jgi:L-fuculose-phosphate aldolase
LSVRLPEGRLLSTPTGISKGFMTPDMMVTLDLDGRPLSGERAPSSEIKMHLEVYRARPEIGAVVHAHPPYATAFSVAGIPLDRCVLPESVLTMGAIPIAPYATPSTPEIPASIRPFVEHCDAVLLQNHGAVTWGRDLTEAWFKLEQLELTATILHHAMALGNVQGLSPDQVQKLGEVRSRLGLSGRVLPCEAAGTCLRAARQSKAAEAAGREDELVETVVRAVLESLQRPSKS